MPPRGGGVVPPVVVLLLFTSPACAWQLLRRAAFARPRASTTSACATTPLGQPAGTPAIIDELIGRVAAGDSELALLPQVFPYELDAFQMDALDALHEGRSVVVSAPTGSGKTVIGELGCYLALARGQRVIYTTPLKALSNQKFSDFQRQFGRERVGLLTGDTCINRDGTVLVMTTEVYRNMLLKEAQPKGAADEEAAAGGEASAEEAAAEPAAMQGDATESSPLDGVAYVVLDEFHYMNDPSRGTVWEECCILSPPSVALIALSATIANTGQITRWLDSIHGPTSLVASDFRPVPLRYYYADNLGVLPLFSSNTAGPGGSPEAPSGVRQRQRQWKLNPKLTVEGRARREVEAMRREGLAGPKGNAARRGGGRARGGGREGEAATDVYDWGRGGGRGGGGRGGGGRGGRGRGDGGAYGGIYGGGGGRGRMRLERDMERQRARQQVPTMPYLVRSLDRQKMVPAIVFIFSRAGCDDAAQAVAAARHALITPQESAAISARVEAFRAAHPALALDEERLAMLSSGVAAHHAGMLPLEKGLVEELFQENLLKAVFATETLAAGVNMPARCTVITVISKRGDNGIAPLKPSALLQMAGRAGRRGMDTLGHVVLCRSPYEDSQAAHALLLQPAEPIASHFYVSYGSALQMLRTLTPEECRGIVGRSFGAFLASSQQRKAAEDLEGVDAQLGEMELLLATYPEEELASYVKLSERLTAERRTLGYLVEQDASEQTQTIEAVVPFVQTGTAILLTDGRPAVLLDDAPAALAARLPSVFSATAVLLLLADASLCIAQPNHLAALDPDLRTSPLPVEARETLLASLPPPSAWLPTPNGSLATAPLTAAAATADADADVDAAAADAPQSAFSAAIDAALAEATAAADADAAGGLEPPPRATPGFAPPTLRAAREAAAAAAATLAAEVPLAMATPEPSAGVLKQQARVEWVEDQLRARPMHADPQLEPLLAAYMAKANLEGVQARLRRKAAAADGGGGRGRGTAAEAASGADGAVAGAETAWRQFESVCDVLRTYAALDEWEATELGDLVAEVAGENELWLALVMLELADKDSLRPEQIAAILSATLDERMRQNAYVGYLASEAVLDTLDELQARADVLAEAQFRAGVAFPIGLEGSACALVEAWAKGETWERLVANTSLDGGDLYRILRRTTELLRSVSAVPYVSDGVKRRASTALRAMNRSESETEPKSSLPSCPCSAPRCLARCLAQGRRFDSQLADSRSPTACWACRQSKTRS